MDARFAFASRSTQYAVSKWVFDAVFAFEVLSIESEIVEVCNFQGACAIPARGIRAVDEAVGHNFFAELHRQKIVCAERTKSFECNAFVFFFILLYTY